MANVPETRPELTAAEMISVFDFDMVDEIRRSHIRRGIKEKPISIVKEVPAAAVLEDEQVKMILVEGPCMRYIYCLLPGERVRFANLVKAITPIMDALFPEKWDIEFLSGESRAMALTVLYPEITIWEANRRSHDMKDLYVRFFFNRNADITGSVRGTRGSVTDVEYMALYAHSHLGEISGFTSFCLGETHFRDLLSKAGSEGLFNPDRITISEEKLLLFESILHQADAFMQHEATDGNPYRNIKNLGVGTSSDINTSQVRQEITKFIAAYKDEPLPFRVDNHYGMKKPTIVLDEDLEEKVLRITAHKQYRDANGNYFSEFSIPEGLLSRDYNMNFTSFNFRGNMVTQEITHPPISQQDLSNKKQYAHRQIINSIINVINNEIGQRRIEYFLNRLRSITASSEGSLTYQAFIGERQANHAREAMFEDMVLLMPNPSQ